MAEKQPSLMQELIYVYFHKKMEGIISLLYVVLKRKFSS